MRFFPCVPRRKFLKCTGVSALTMASGGLLAGCVSRPDGEEDTTFGVPQQITAGGQVLATVTLESLRTEPIGISINEVTDLLGAAFPDIPFNPSITGLTGLVRVMPEAILESSGGLLLVLPYFTNRQLRLVVGRLAGPALRSNRDPLCAQLTAILNEHDSELRALLRKAIGGILTPSAQKQNERFIDRLIKKLLDGLSENQRRQLVDAIVGLLQDLLAQASDTVHLLMVKGSFDGRSGASDIDVGLHAVALAYTLYDGESETPLLANLVPAGEARLGALPLGAGRRWRSGTLRILPRRLALGLDTTTLSLGWDEIYPLVFAAARVLFGEKAGCLAVPLYDLVLSSFDSLQYRVEELPDAVPAVFRLRSRDISTTL